MAKRQRIRTAVQIAWTALSNGYLAGFTNGTIFRGTHKNICLPGLNCYSCPGALGSCPLGALQATLSDRNYRLAFYVTGFLMLFGSIFGRMVCGFLCPFGLVQDLLYKIPLPKKWRSRKLLPGDRFLKWLKYLLLILFCILLPMVVVDTFGQGKPWFCAYVCPSGTFLGGIPLVAANEGLRAVLGWLWNWKLGLLIGILLLSLFFYRPFCRYLCPLGAVYGCFNPISLVRYRVETEKCIGCGRCKIICPFDLDPSKKPNSADCIRCGRCLDACPTGALGMYRKHK